MNHLALLSSVAFAAVDAQDRDSALSLLFSWAPALITGLYWLLARRRWMGFLLGVLSVPVVTVVVMGATALFEPNLRERAAVSADAAVKMFVWMLVLLVAIWVTNIGLMVWGYRLPIKGTKACPQCAEAVKQTAAVCRHCGHEFAATPRAELARGSGRT